VGSLRMYPRSAAVSNRGRALLPSQGPSFRWGYVPFSRENLQKVRATMRLTVRKKIDEVDNDGDSTGCPGFSFEKSEVSRESSSSSHIIYGETAEERITRIKRGGMTAEEKEAFLKTALGRTAEEKKKNYLARGTIRQELPQGPSNERDSRGNPQQGSSSQSADTSWSTVVGRKRMEGETKILELDNQAKEAWFNMVTAPNRFQSYSAVQGSPSSEPWPPVTSPAPTPENQSDRIRELNDAKQRLMEQQKIFEDMGSGGNMGDKAASPFLPKVPSSEVADAATISSEPPVSKAEKDDLASRLEQAAILQEEKETEARRVMEKERAAREKALAEEQRKMQLRAEQKEVEFRRIEAEKLSKRKKEEDEKRKLEEAKLKQMQAAQDAYWKKKLEEEQARRSPQDSPEDKETKMKFEEAEAKHLEKEAKLRKIRMEEVLREDERNLLEKAEIDRKEAMARTKAITDLAAQKASNEETRRLNLNELNSPLPTKSSGTQQSATPLQNISSPLPSLTKSVASQPAVPSPTPRLNLSEFTNPETRKDRSEPVPPEAQSSPRPRLSLSELTKLKKDQEEKEDFAAKENVPPPPRRTGPIRQKITSFPDSDVPVRKGPIRQKLTPPPPNVATPTPPQSQTTKKEKGWSASEADKKKASKWGINIDNF